MDLNEKIKEIRNKPEYVRIRYVWGAVGVCMFFILALWIFSIKDTIKTMGGQVKSSGSCMTDFKKKFDGLSEGKAPSIKEMLDQTGQKLESGMSVQNNGNNKDE